MDTLLGAWGYEDDLEYGTESQLSRASEEILENTTTVGTSFSPARANHYRGDRLRRPSTPGGLLTGIFRSRHLSPRNRPARQASFLSVGTNNLSDKVSHYWQNYDLSISEAPKLFSDAEFEAVKRIKHGLEVLILRKRLKERISMRHREREIRAAVRVQAIVRGRIARAVLPMLRKQHILGANIKRDQKQFKRELRTNGFIAYLYRQKDGALRKVTIRPNGKLDSLCWSTGVARVNTGSMPLIALKNCYAGYPKQDFPTSSMKARATPLPDRDKTFTLQRDDGLTYIFSSAEDIRGPSRAQLVRGLQAIIDEISSPDSFYFDATGVLRRVTSSIFDDRGNTAQREARRKRRQEMFRRRQEGLERQQTAPHYLQGPVREDTEDECRTVSLHAGNDNTVGRQALSIAYIQARTEGHCIPCYQQKQATGHLIHVTSDIPRNIGGARSSRREESRPGVVCDADNRSSEQV